MKSKIGIIIGREYRTRVFKRSFILLTILVPVLLVAVMVLPALLSSMDLDEQRVAIIDRTGLYAHRLASTESYEFVVADMTLDEYKSSKGEEDTYSAFLEIRQDLIEDPEALTLYAHKTLPTGLEDYVNRTLSTIASDEKLEQSNVEGIKEIVRSSKVNVKVRTYTIGDDGSASASSGAISAIIGLVLAFMSYIFVSIYGGMVLQGVLEEKKSRIMEVMVSSVRPFDLMMGKIVGIGLVGLTQQLIWAVLIVVLGIVAQFAVIGSLYSPEAVAMAQTSGSMSVGQATDINELFAGLAQVNFWELGILFVLYFVGGYLLYAALYAALGSSVSSDEDSAQLTTPVTLIMLISFYVGFAVVNNPESSLAFWASMIPFTAPQSMLIRLSYGVEWWEPVLSIVLLYASFIGITFVGAKIYRVGVLSYGKKPTLRELWRWLRDY